MTTYTALITIPSGERTESEFRSHLVAVLGADAIGPSLDMGVDPHGPTGRFAVAVDASTRQEAEERAMAIAFKVAPQPHVFVLDNVE